MKTLNFYSKSFLGKFLLFFSASLGLHSARAFNGDITFDYAEYAEHQRVSPKLVVEAGRCLEETFQYHRKFMAKWGVSPFYGDRSAFGVMNDQARRQYLVSIGKPAELLEQLSPMSCVGLSLRCLKRGFESVGQAATWAKIYDYVQLNDVDGMVLQSALQKLGWNLYYWNANPALNKLWDEEEKNSDPLNEKRFWGYHDYRYITVNGANHRYMESTVNDWTTLVNFGGRAPRMFRRAKFFLGTAHGGYHVFPGTEGQVIEGHSMRDIRDPNTIEASPFAPLQRGGGPNGPYRSGLIALPPN